MRRIIIGMAAIALLTGGCQFLGGRQGQNGNAAPTATPEVVQARPTETPRPTNTPVVVTATPEPRAPQATATPATTLRPPTGGQQQPPSGPVNPGPNVSGGMCEGLHDYGVLGKVELSAGETKFIHLQFWLRGEMNYEMETLLPAGRYLVLKPNLDGHVWELGPNCSAEQALKQHVGPSIQRRINFKVDNRGYVYWEQLIRDGILSVAAQTQPVPTVPQALNAVASVQNAPQGAPVTGSSGPVTSGVVPSGPAAPTTCSDGVREDYQPGSQAWTPAGEYRIVNFWSNRPGVNQAERKLLLKPGESPKLLGGGSSWSWPASCESTVMAEYAKNPKSEVTLDQLVSQGLAQR